MDRRELLKSLGLSVGALAVGSETFGRRLNENTFEYTLPKNEAHKTPAKPITAITLGAGSRGTVYGNFADKFPEQVKIVGVADPNEYRRNAYQKKHSIPDAQCYTSWEEVLKKPKMADTVIISMPDHLHYKPALAALQKGYDILLEKPIAQTEQECLDILAMAKKTGRIVAVCHVLRYAPYFVKMKELIQQKAIGDVISIQHFEPIEHVHMSHSYVRGIWHNSKASTPIILAKSCHDLDIIKWMIEKPCKRIVAMGDLKWFTKANAPEGSTARCTDGCKVERECPYSAIKIYKERKRSPFVFDLPADKSLHDAVMTERLKTTNYGRCVYRMENDQPDHYITSIEFEGNITANFSMEAFTSYHGRRTRVMGSMGDMVGDMNELVVTDFRTRKSVTLTPKAEDVEGYKNSGHGGGDWLLMRDFVQAVSQQNAKLLTTTIEDSIESHVMGFRAERSRLSGKVINIQTV